MSVDRDLERAEKELERFGKELERAADKMLRQIDRAEREERRARHSSPIRAEGENDGLNSLDLTTIPLWKRILPTIGNIRAYIRDLEQRLAQIEDHDPAQAAELRQELADAKKILRLLLEPW